MIALMQRGILLALVMAAVAWLGWTLGSGHGSWAWLGLILLTGGHALALAIEFGWMHAVNGRDSAPRARSGQVLIAWLGECSHAPRVFCWRQPFRARRYADMLSEESSRRGVVLVHGFFCNRGLWNRWLARLHTDGTPTIALNLEPPFGSIDDYAPEIGRAVAVLTQRTGKAPVVVAHSMGGLALRHWWNGEGNMRRIHHAITLGTPHHGTRVAILATSVNGRQMRPDSAWLAELRAADRPDRAARMTCFYSHCDNIVFPASSATLPGALNRHLAATAHVAMVDHSEPWAELQLRLKT